MKGIEYMDYMKMRDGDVAAVDCEEVDEEEVAVVVAEKIQFFDKKVSSLKAAIINDDAPNFINEMVWLYASYEKDKEEEELCPPYVMNLICISSALSCATALLEGKVPGLCGATDIQLNSAGCPLHIAAACFDYDLVELFLNAGASTYVTITTPNGKIPNTLPINVALDSLNRHVYLCGWFDKRDSLYELIFLLCLPQMKVALETIWLIALKTADINEVFIDYAKKGMFIEMAALLMVGDELIFVEGSMSSIRDMIKGDIELIGDEIRKALLFNNGDNSILVEEMRKRMETLMLLVIFDKAGMAIRSYLARQSHNLTKEEVAKDVASILKDKGGYVLKLIDMNLCDLDCESDEIKEASGTSKNITSYKSNKYKSMILSTSDDWYCMNQRSKRELQNLKYFSSILKETIYVAKGLDIDLSKTVNNINDAMAASERITAYIYNTYTEMHLPGTQLYYLCSVNRFYPPRSSGRYCFKKFQENHCKETISAMQRPSTSGNILASLAFLLKKGIRRL